MFDLHDHYDPFLHLFNVRLNSQRHVTARVHEICLLTTTLLDMFFDVLLSNADDDCLGRIIPALFTRSGLLFG
jgi:hypothetical protein